MSIPREYDGYSFEVILVPVKPELKSKHYISRSSDKSKHKGDAVASQGNLRNEQMLALAGTWVEDSAMDKAFADMDAIDGELWK